MQMEPEGTLAGKAQRPGDREESKAWREYQMRAGDSMRLGRLR